VSDVTETGAASVELALLIPVVVLVILAVAEIAVVARVQLEVVNAAREGAREAATSPDSSVAVAAAAAVLGDAAGAARITVSRPHTVGAPARVEVILPHRLASIVFGGMTVEVRGRATMRVEQ
jgi:Flp pilus assembly protein TadG